MHTGPVAQSVEYMALNHGVVGSNPTGLVPFFCRSWQPLKAFFGTNMLLFGDVAQLGEQSKTFCLNDKCLL